MKQVPLAIWKSVVVNRSQSNVKSLMKPMHLSSRRQRSGATWLPNSLVAALTWTRTVERRMIHHPLQHQLTMALQILSGMFLNILKVKKVWGMSSSASSE